MSGLAPALNCDSPVGTLPAALTELTERVVRGTWLWPSEKRDVRAELESHFREGLIELTREGMSIEESVAMLRDDFGDPKLAAALIRRGKKRGRSMIWKTFLTTMSVALCGGVTAGGYAAYLYFGKPTPTVDYIEKLNEPTQQIAQQDRAWPLLREVLLNAQPMPAELVPMANNLPKPGDELWETAVAWATSNRSLIPHIAEAAARPSYGMVYDQGQSLEFLRLLPSLGTASTTNVTSSEQADLLIPPTISLLLPHLAPTRDLARLLLIDSRDHATRGEFNDAWSSLDTAFRLGTHQMQGQTLIEQLVGAAMIRMAASDMCTLLYDQRYNLTTEQIRMLQASAIAGFPSGQIRARIGGEVMMFEDVVQYTFTDDGSGNGRLIPTQYAKVASLGATPEKMGYSANDPITRDARLLAIAAAHADRRTTLSKYHELFDRMEELYPLPLYDQRRIHADELVLEMLPEDSGDRFALISMLLPAMGPHDQRVREAAQQQTAVQTMIALAAFRTEVGRFPGRLVELTPKYLAQPPIDIYAGVHMKYAASADGFMLYSIGRNLTDDGGSTEPIPQWSGTDVATHPSDIVFCPVN